MLFGLFNNELNISAQDAMEWMKSSAEIKLLDIREKREWDGGHIQGAVLATDQVMKEVLSKWDKNIPIVCYCASGMRSLQAAKNLSQNGFTNVKSMKGGILSWAHQAGGKITR
ncbi:MAG: rhodanese-like domain-containing protein [Deltaproteobacteria bacterium]|nr:rhodanese-like domain-containing protein [Deltaproteobacteria bacterium]